MDGTRHPEHPRAAHAPAKADRLRVVATACESWQSVGTRSRPPTRQGEESGGTGIALRRSCAVAVCRQTNVLLCLLRLIACQ